MSATPKYLSQLPIDALREQDIIEIREWERFKWLARGLTEVVDRWDVAELEQLLEEPPSLPGQREKVVVLLALKASKQAIEALERIEMADGDDSFAHLHDVALRYARSRTR